MATDRRLDSAEVRVSFLVRVRGNGNGLDRVMHMAGSTCSLFVVDTVDAVGRLLSWHQLGNLVRKHGKGE